MATPKSVIPLKPKLNSSNLSDYIIFEDQQIVAINKPEGFLSIPDGYDDSMSNLKDLLCKKYGEIWVVHRLDKKTSGVIIFAKNPEAHRFFNQAFTNKEFEKSYLGIAHGHPFWDMKMINYALHINGDRRHRSVYDPIKGNLAKTMVRVLFKQIDIFGIEIFPRNGYTHQIRAHLSMLGHPIMGDTLYNRLRVRDHAKCIGQPQSENGMFLHAQSLKLPPQIYSGLVISAPIPEKYMQYFK